MGRVPQGRVNPQSLILVPRGVQVPSFLVPSTGLLAISVWSLNQIPHHLQFPGAGDCLLSSYLTFQIAFGGPFGGVAR